ncbi:MAG: TetR/AcrR family transcriptional regulator [Spirochaetota bacterium]
MAQKSVKEQMLHIASDQFYKKGFEATSVKTIVELCGTTAPALYHHFGSKEGLALAYLDNAAVKRSERLKPAFVGQTLTEIVEAWIECIKADIAQEDFLGCNIGNFSSQLNQSAERSATHARLQAKVCEIIESWIIALVNRLQQLQKNNKLSSTVDPEELAIQFITVYEGGLLMWRATGRDSAIDSLANQFRMICETALKT